MASILQIPTATTTVRTGLTLLAAEIVYDTDLDSFWGGDGTTAGGILLADLTVTDGDKGDITVTASGLTWTIDASAITAGKIATGAVTAAKIAAMTSAQLATIVSDETGSGSLVFATSPTLVTPALGTPASGVLTNATGYPGDSSLTTVGTVTTGDVDAVVSAASATVAGKVELATIAEVDTGTDTARAITPAGLAGSALQTKVDGVEALADVTDATNVAAAGAVLNTGAENIGGVKTFTSDPIVPDEAYGAGWDGSLEVPTKNAVYDKIQTLAGGTVTRKEINAAAHSTGWDQLTSVVTTTITLTNNYISGTTAVYVNGQLRYDITEATANTLTTGADYSAYTIAVFYESTT